MRPTLQALQFTFLVEASLLNITLRFVCPVREQNIKKIQMKLMLIHYYISITDYKIHNFRGRFLTCHNCA